jgi:hypothetical protein
MNNYNASELIGNKNRLHTVEETTSKSQNENSEDDFSDIEMIENIPEDFLTEFEEEHEVYKDGCLRYDKNNLAYYFVRISFYKASRIIRELLYKTECWLSENKAQEDQPEDDYNPFDKDDCAEYFDDVQVLVLHDYPIIFAYKIGSTYEECKLIGCHHNICSLYESIGNYLDAEKQKMGL